MDAQKFKNDWVSKSDNLEPFDEKSINSLDLSDSTKALLRVGLPSAAAPFLQFGYSSGASLQSAAEEFDLSNDFDSFKIIGFNAYGDPICIDENEGDIVYLNHDDEFGYVFMNSSLGQLAYFLLIIREFIQKTKIVPSSELQSLVASTIKELNYIDKMALSEGDWEDSIRSFAE